MKLIIFCFALCSSLAWAQEPQGDYSQIRAAVLDVRQGRSMFVDSQIRFVPVEGLNNSEALIALSARASGNSLGSDFSDVKLQRHDEIIENLKK
ncbi:MAG: hypothetical protein AABZ31_10920 [Bdellovibrionota bacterium]